MSTQIITIIVGLMLLVGFHVKVSAEEVRPNGSESEPSALKTLFLNQPTREKIDKQRQSYLNPVEEKKTVQILPKGTGSSNKAKQIYIPPKVTVSAIIVKPDGSRLVRVNDKYNRSPSKHINMDFANSSTNGVPVTVQGKSKVVPVGSTLMTRQNKLVKTYKLEETKRNKAMPKTEQKAVKQALEQVKILTPK